MEDAVREQGGHGDRLEHRLKQRLMREPWHPSTLSSKLGKAEILARSIIKNGPITNSKRRATDIEKGAGIREAATVRIRIKSALSWKGETRHPQSCVPRHCELGLSLHGSVANVVIGFPFAASRSLSKWVIYQPEC